MRPTLINWIFVFGAGIFLGAFLHKMSSIGPAPVVSVPGASPVLERPTSPVATPASTRGDGQDLATLQATVAQLEYELAEAKDQARTEKAARDEFEAGLEKAVGELNRLSGENRVLSSFARAPQPRQSPAGDSYDPHQHVIVRRPAVSGVGHTVVVAGSVHNASGEDVYGTLEVIVNRGGTERRLTFPMDIPARTVVEYSDEIRHSSNGGNTTATAAWLGG